ncbi:hypothetical protein SAMN04487886_10294 [Clostridium sp. DSM 8431]|uniref:hypothetical protein n=1 Tax=Clostridium sp. DSM 8431 TaxID=1761781 RepID=UPI0008EEEF41|nr:hypothetical protein [Clostridium sp. DSM 8431]SFU44543.1 hypothetical protein SAMN04487886_10294 [Clostridium sp. DSM 8431]
MRINNNLVFTNNNIYTSNKNVKNQKNKNNELKKTLEKSILEKQLRQNNDISKNLIPFSKRYNLSYINQSLNIYNKDLNEDEEKLTLELDKEIYDKCCLKQLKGFEFNSPEFFKWKKENPHFGGIPMDAPAKIRKTLKDMLEDIPTEGALRFQVGSAIQDSLENYDTTDPNSFIKAFDNIINDKKDYINLVEINGTGSKMDKDAIKSSQDIINFITYIKEKISCLI